MLTDFSPISAGDVGLQLIKRTRSFIIAEAGQGCLLSRRSIRNILIDPCQRSRSISAKICFSLFRGEYLPGLGFTTKAATVLLDVPFGFFGISLFFFDQIQWINFGILST